MNKFYYLAAAYAVLLLEYLFFSVYWRLTVGKFLSVYNVIDERIEKICGIPQVGHKFICVFFRSLWAILIYTVLFFIIYFTSSLRISNWIGTGCYLLLTAVMVINLVELRSVKGGVEDFCENDKSLISSFKPNIVAYRINFIYIWVLLLLLACAIKLV